MKCSPHLLRAPVKIVAQTSLKEKENTVTTRFYRDFFFIPASFELL